MMEKKQLSQKALEGGPHGACGFYVHRTDPTLEFLNRGPYIHTMLTDNTMGDTRKGKKKKFSLGLSTKPEVYLCSRAKLYNMDGRINGEMDRQIDVMCEWDLHLNTTQA